MRLAVGGWLAFSVAQWILSSITMRELERQGLQELDSACVNDALAVPLSTKRSNTLGGDANAANPSALTFTARHPRWAFAYKFPPRKEITRILSILPSVGRTGVVTPVAIMLPVEIGGVRIEGMDDFNLRLEALLFQLFGDVGVAGGGQESREPVEP